LGHISTEDQGRGFSLPTQREACLAHAASLGYTVPEAYVFSENYTGTSLRRPQLTLLRDLVQQRSVQAVIVYDSDRLSRKLAHQLLLQDEFDTAGVDLHIVPMPDRSATPEGQLLAQMRGVIAEFERAKLLERTRRGREGCARAGHVPYGGRTYGYVYVKVRRESTV
jgi:site-specific DNA recombinase